MRTTDDLRAVFADFEASAPTELRHPDRVLAPSHRRYRVLVAAAVAVIVAGIAVGLAVTRPKDTTPPAHPRPSQSQCSRNAHCPVLDDNGNPVPAPTSFTLGLTPTHGLRLMSHSLTPTAETLSVEVGSSTVTVTSYAPGSAPRFVPLENAAVPGHDALYVTTANSPPYTAILWSEHDRTVVVSGDTAGAPILSKVARAVRAESQPVALPYRFGKLPAGLVPESISVSGNENAPGGVFAEVGFTDGKPTQQSDNFYVGSAAIAVATGVEPGLDGARRVGTTADGHGIYTGGTQPWGEATTVQVALTAHNAAILLPNPARLNTYSAQDLTNIADQMSFASKPDDPTTWYTTNLFPN
jgi:hypothetical protein